MAGVAFLVAVLVAAVLALRFTTPLRRLTEASRALAEGDLSVPRARPTTSSSPSELAALATQFNAMADQVEESLERIRRDRDRSRDFLADVSHELRTPIAALLTFNELLTERTGEDPAGGVPRLAASSSSGSTGSPRTCSSSRSSIPGSSCSTSGPTTSGSRSNRPWSSAGRGERNGLHLRLALPSRPSGSATTRSGSARS